MGASTYTTTVKPLTVMGDKRIHVIKYTISSYGTDGVPLTSAIAGMAEIDHVIGITFDTAVANGPVAGIWSPTNETIVFHKASNSGVDATTVFNAYVTVMGS